jgi:predicted nucleic acid-binding protein
MSLVYIDTNVFLDFYQASTDRLTVFEDIVGRSKSVLLTQQTVNEFRRNRVNCLAKLVGQIEKAPNPQLYTTAVVRALPGFQEWDKAKDAAKKAAQEIAKELTSWLTNEESDPVLTAFEKLVVSAKLIDFDDALILRARQRKILGQPPTSPDKHTIGDELIWESLLTWKEDDLVVVTRDTSFLDNRAILKKEFESKTGKSLIDVTGSLAQGLKATGQDAEKIEEAEKKLLSETSQAAREWTIVRNDNGIAMVTDGRRAGIRPTAANPHHSWQCPNCGNAGPWNGVICLSCGQMSDPSD